MDKKESKTGVISSIFRDGKRVLLHLQHDEGSVPCHARTSESEAKNLKEGDTIVYDPLGRYCGIFPAKKDAPVEVEISTERKVLIRKCAC